jgi:hypothetical protein
MEPPWFFSLGRGGGEDPGHLPSNLHLSRLILFFSHRLKAFRIEKSFYIINILYIFTLLNFNFLFVKNWGGGQMSGASVPPPIPLSALGMLFLE